MNGKNVAAYYVGDNKFSLETAPIYRPLSQEVQVAIAYCGICGTDMHVYGGHMDQRVGKHRVIGHEMSGVITEVGSDVFNLQVGDPVVVRPLQHCGKCSTCQRGLTHICENLKFLGLDSDGAFQQYWTVPAHTIHKLPPNLPLSDAAIVEPLAVACHDVDRARVCKNEDVLVIGAGPIGLLIAMVARESGANVIVSEVDPKKIRYTKSLGFTVVNASLPGQEASLLSKTNQKGFDVIFDASGVQAAVDLFTKVSATRARICMVAIHTNKPQIDLFKFFWQELELIGARVYESKDFDKAISLLANKQILPEHIVTGIKPLKEIQKAFTPKKTLNIKTLISVTPELV
ncbi:alcohol dehydrogenase catalytic domain-containing protein [Parasalinivibrio latis]|uniref:zinc-dependent alcohol dehydrogenase n=1 Tax=Parasalinivibrio latis TaxID=2952610 RepID=UPI0030E401C0